MPIKQNGAQSAALLDSYFGKYSWITATFYHFCRPAITLEQALEVIGRFPQCVVAPMSHAWDSDCSKQVLEAGVHFSFDRAHQFVPALFIHCRCGPL